VTTAPLRLAASASELADDFAVPVVANVPGDRPLGAAVTVRLEALDRVTRTSVFALLPR
jgi:hypothetical protein